MERAEIPEWEAANREIIEKLQAGDRELVEVLLQRLVVYFRRHWKPLAHDAEDLAKDTLVQAFELLEEFPGDHPIEWWLSAIAKNIGRHALRSFCRHKGPDTEPLHELEDWEDLQREEDFSDRLLKAMYLESFLERLEPDHRTIVQRRIYEQRSWAEIASELGIPVNAAETRFQRILKKLGQWIEAEEPELKVERRR
jgi:RNA polymerase sigma factor (sigma-70 family)